MKQVQILQCSKCRAYRFDQFSRAGQICCENPYEGHGVLEATDPAMAVLELSRQARAHRLRALVLSVANPITLFGYWLTPDAGKRMTSLRFEIETNRVDASLKLKIVKELKSQIKQDLPTITSGEVA